MWQKNINNSQLDRLHISKVHKKNIFSDLLGDEPIAESVENLKNFYTSEVILELYLKFITSSLT